MATSDQNLAILRELYNELRNYRDKEFKTFTFSFPILGLGLVPNIEKPNLVVIIILTTIFGLVMVRYLYKNHYRMLKIKNAIYDIQEAENINKTIEVLKPKEWVTKSTERHLGTWTYIGVLCAEMVMTWCFYIWYFMK